MKKYDLFVSYSHSDRSLVEKFASELRKRHLRVWFDGWEMRPGDILRERISAGIADASFFLVVLSPESLASNWVKYELNAGMIDEIERGHVRVIPAIAGGATVADLPADLRAKYCLDLRAPLSRKSALDALADLVAPEDRLRKELMSKLRSAGDDSPATIALLREHALRHGDQTVQASALRGLAGVRSASATLVVAERLFDSWGMNALKVALKVLARKRDFGGLLVLVALVHHDLRLAHEKLDRICSVIADEDPSTVDGIRACQRSDAGRERLVRVDAVLRESTVPDVRHGACLALSFGFWSSLYDRPAPPSQADVVAAEAYANRVVPGLVALLRSQEGSPSPVAREFNMST
ncbi:toll/interleukin-1 receptor domain-containing protein [Micromonosporaceae bacterium B7E4]